jgi:hypothetical protein
MSVDQPASIASTPTTLTTVTGAIRKAAKATGASFDYLLTTAKVESGLNPDLSTRSSSATGLFQFIEQTWLEVMKEAGTALGFGRYADAITETSSGRYEVADPAMRAEIMKLRKDPTANAALGGVFTQQNASILTERIDRKPTEGELYIAHFFGAYSAAKVIRTAVTNPSANAAEMFPAAARANQSIFYDKQGNARSVGGVYQELVRRYQVARASPTQGATSTLATSAPASAATATAHKPYVLPEDEPATVESRHFVPVAAGASQAFAVTDTQPSSAKSSQPSDDSRSMFLSLFKSDGRRSPVSSTVNDLWGHGNARLRGSAVAGTSASAFAPAAKEPAENALSLDLFRDMPTNVRGLFKGDS